MAFTAYEVYSLGRSPKPKNTEITPPTALDTITAPKPEAKALYNQAIDLENHQAYTEAAAKFKASGEAGYGRGWYCFGLMAMEGNGISKDYSAAAAAFGKALSVGNDALPESLWKLAWLYEQGLGVSKDPDFSKQLRSYALSDGEQGLQGRSGDDVEGRKFLAGLWEEGKTGRQDLIRAADLYGRAGNHEKRLLLLARVIAEGDDEAKSQALLRMARIYDDGHQGLKLDASMAFTYFQRAGSHGNSEALFEVSRCYAWAHGVAKNEESAFLALKAATECKTQSAMAWLDLGRAYLNGTGTSKDSIEAFRCFQNAENMVPSISAGELASCLERGLGTPPDLVKAGQLYTLANNSDEARNVLLRAMQEKKQGAALALAEANIKAGRHRSAETVLKDEAARGTPEAMALAGLLKAGLADDRNDGHEVIEPIEASVEEALPMLLSAAEKSQTRATLGLYRLLKTRIASEESTLRGKIERAVQSAASKGDLECQLAWMDILVRRADKESLTKAEGVGESLMKQPANLLAKAEYVTVFADLGLVYLKKAQNASDFLRARKWLQFGAHLDDEEAWNGLARLYDGGKALPADPNRAAYCKLRAMFAVIRGESGC
ncbi:MAG: sel1 repeat family protein [Holophagaceae bacterium]|nr:sel1 repeat family protein [Holophagaceae bacterium]